MAVVSAVEAPRARGRLAFAVDTFTASYSQIFFTASRTVGALMFAATMVEPMVGLCGGGGGGGGPPPPPPAGGGAAGGGWFPPPPPP